MRAGLVSLVLILATRFGADLMAQTPAPTPAPQEKAPPAQTYRVSRATGPIKVDGVLNEDAWKAAAKMELPYETFPADNTPAPVKTEALITYDGDFLYVAFRASDPKPAQIRARLSDRDKASSDDFVGIVLDTFNDERRGFEFFVNPLGVQMDLAINDVGGGEDSSWDALWNSAGRVTDQGYTVEVSIPFTSLRFRRANGEQTWGFDLVRVYPRSQRHVLGLQPRDRNRNCYLCQISKMAGFEGISPGRNLEFDPTVTSQRTDTRDEFPSGPLSEGDVDFEPGLTARWGITPNLTLGGAINPDFSQIEADAAQLDINTQFALFFPEKRPFFLEGADFFETNFNIVHTRQVADPDWGLKLTGKEGKHALGVFVARDSLTNLTFPGSQASSLTSLNDENLSGALRYRFDIGKSSTLGALYAGREGDEYSNHVLGLDGFIRFTQKDTIIAQVLGSQTQYPDSVAARFRQPEGSFDDRALLFVYRHSDRNWFWRARYEDVGESFRADLGFMPRVNYRMGVLGLERTWWGGKDDWYSRFFVGGDWDRTEEQNGRLLEEEYEVRGGIGGPLQSFLFLGVGTSDQFFNGKTFNRKFLNTFGEIRPTADLYVNFEANLGDQIDFAHTRTGERVQLEPGIRYNFGKHLRLELDHSFEKLDVRGGRLFEANLTQLRSTYQFNIRTFVRAILQYTDIQRNTGLYAFPVEPETRRLFTQLLFSYKINPQTVFFLGYSDNRTGDDRVDLTQRNRTVFIKIGYAWLL